MKQLCLAMIFDTGLILDNNLQFLDKEKFKVNAIFLTHTHRDHIACLDDLKENTGNSLVYVHKLELLDGCVNLLRRGFEYSLGTLSLCTKHTYGHSVGGTTFLNGLSKPVAIVER